MTMVVIQVTIGNSDDMSHLREGLLGSPVVEGAIESLPGGHPHPVV